MQTIIYLSYLFIAYNIYIMLNPKALLQYQVAVKERMYIVDLVVLHTAMNILYLLWLLAGLFTSHWLLFLVLFGINAGFNKLMRIEYKVNYSDTYKMWLIIANSIIQIILLILILN